MSLSFSGFLFPITYINLNCIVGCDGGRSSVRSFLEANHGITMDGDWVDTLWGAIDAVVKSDFPDLRKIGMYFSQVLRVKRGDLGFPGDE